MRKEQMPTEGRAGAGFIRPQRSVFRQETNGGELLRRNDVVRFVLRGMVQAINLEWMPSRGTASPRFLGIPHLWSVER